MAEWEAAARGLAKKASKNEKLLNQLLEGILSKDDKTRYTSFKALMHIADNHPELLYPYWGNFARLIDSENAYSRYMACYLVASLAFVDRDDRFEKLFDKYYGMLNDKSVVPAAHAAANSGKIAQAKPGLEPKITEKLLSIDATRHKPHHKELIKSYAIEAFGEYFGQAHERQTILDFVRKQVDSESPRTRKKAKEFLMKWAK